MRHDRANDPAGEPSIAEMTEKAIRDAAEEPAAAMYLMVEGVASTTPTTPATPTAP